MTREPIYAAVFAFFQALTAGGSPLFQAATRKASTFDDWPAEMQPTLLLTQIRETAQFRKGLPTVWRCNINLLVYVYTGAANDLAIVPSELMNPLLDAIEGALTIDDVSNQCCTLGGLVSHCAIEGPIEIYEGDLADQAYASIPIMFLTSP